MDRGDQASTISPGEQVARIVWSSQILSYLAKDCNLSESRRVTETDVLPVEQVDDKNSVAEHENDGEDHDDDGVQSVTDSQQRALLSAPQDDISKKLLNCIAQLVSAKQGWGHVTATALKTHEDFVEIFIARNDCFADDEAAARDLCASLEAQMRDAWKGCW